MKYTTKHKITVLNLFKEHQDEHLSMEEISSLLDNSVPLATLYRIVDSLVNEDIVRKYVIDKNNSACFQFNNSDELHFHLVCSSCGQVYHLKCHEVEHLLKHISDEHHFKVDISKVNLYGLCPFCQEKV